MKFNPETFKTPFVQSSIQLINDYAGKREIQLDSKTWESLFALLQSKEQDLVKENFIFSRNGEEVSYEDVLVNEECHSIYLPKSSMYLDLKAFSSK